MQNPLTSRSIISDKIYKKFSQTAYDIHKQKLKKIYTNDSLKRQIENDKQSKKNMKRLISNRKAYESCHQKIDPKIKLQNKSLLKNIQKILTRRSNSEINLHFGKNHLIQSQKKEIKKENKILVQKLALSKLDVSDIKKNLLKQIQQYEDKKNMIRKLKQTPTEKGNSLTKRKSLSSKKIPKSEDKKLNSIIQNKNEN